MDDHACVSRLKEKGKDPEKLLRLGVHSFRENRREDKGMRKKKGS